MPASDRGLPAGWDEMATPPPVSSTIRNGAGPFALVRVDAYVPGGVTPASVAATAGGQVVAQDGRPVFDGRARGPSARSTFGGRADGEVRLDPFPTGTIPGDVSESESDGLAAGRLEVPSPQRSELLTDFRPLDRTSLESAIDRFLRPFDGLVAGRPGPRGSDELVADFVVLAVALSASKVALRSLGRAADERAVAGGANAIADVDVDDFSGMAGPWGPGET